MSRAITPAEVLTLGLDATAVLLALIELAVGRAALATTRRQLADLAGISPRRVGAAIARLHDAGLLRRTYGRRGARCWFRIFGLPTAVACGNGAGTQRKRVARRCGTGAVPQGRIACGTAPRTQGRACGTDVVPQARSAACGIETDTQGRPCGLGADTQEGAPVVSERDHSSPTGKIAATLRRRPLAAAGRQDVAAVQDTENPGGPLDAALVRAFEHQLAKGDNNA